MLKLFVVFFCVFYFVFESDILDWIIFPSGGYIAGSFQLEHVGVDAHCAVEPRARVVNSEQRRAQLCPYKGLTGIKEPSFRREGGKDSGEREK